MDLTLLPENLLLLLKKHQLNLDASQPHIGGERSLLSPGKLVLMATTGDNQPVVVKYAISLAGAKEIAQEANVRLLFEKLPFSIEQFHLPKIITYETTTTANFLVSEFIEQPKILHDYTLQEQFFMSLHTLENQESFHATTVEHYAYIRNYFPITSVATYQSTLAEMSAAVAKQQPLLAPLLAQVEKEFQKNTSILGTYGDYLVHTDFVLHNLRIKDNQMYLLDYVSFRIANKYEAWARYVNFMEVHQPELAKLLVSYLEQDRNPHELTSFWLLRLYRIVFLLNYYCSIYSKTTGELHELTTLRIDLWSQILSAVYHKTAIPPDLITTYSATRDGLRTENEKERQRSFTRAN